MTLNERAKSSSEFAPLVKKGPPQKDWLDMNQIIREVIAPGQSEMQRNHVALETQLSHDMPLVFADRIQLQQVMLNLMMNATEAMTQVTAPRELLISSGQMTRRVWW